MTGLVRKATLLLSACGLLAASAVFADVPDPGNSSFNILNLVGHDGVSPDPFSPFTVNVKDIAGNPIQGSVVVVDFSLCSDISFCEDQLGNSTADCATRTVRKSTDVNGDATFNIIGGVRTTEYLAFPAGSPCNCVKVYADGVLIVEAVDEPVNAGAFDLDNTDGAGGADLTLWIDDFGGTLNPPRSDYDHDPADNCTTGGGVGGADLTIWIDWFGATGSPFSCSATKCTP